MMNMKQLGFGLLGAMSLALAGCGGGGGGAAAQPAAVPSPTGYYQTQGSQPYTCSSNLIQLRNAFGQPQCFNTTDLGQACMQARGMLQGGLCRSERTIPSARGVFSLRNVQPNYPVTLPGLSAALFAGESLKISGNVDNGYGDAEWDAQLLQGGMSVGSASSQSTVMNGRNSNDNFEIVAIGSAYAQTAQQYPTAYPTAQYPQQYPQTGAYPYNQYPSAYPTQYPGQYPTAYPQVAQSSMIPQSYDLQIMFRYREPKLKMTLKMSAVTCQDGHGNNYACQ